MKTPAGSCRDLIDRIIPAEEKDLTEFIVRFLTIGDNIIQTFIIERLAFGVRLFFSLRGFNAWNHRPPPTSLCDDARHLILSQATKTSSARFQS